MVGIGGRTLVRGGRTFGGAVPTGPVVGVAALLMRAHHPPGGTVVGPLHQLFKLEADLPYLVREIPDLIE
jgi:hypothetical protein